MKRLKILLKPAIIFLLGNALSYLLYLLLLVLGIVHYYELESASSVANIGVFCFYYLSGAVMTIVLTSVIKLEKSEKKVLLAMLILLNIASMSFWGAQDICTLLLGGKANAIVINVVAYLLSAVTLCLSAIAGFFIAEWRYARLYSDEQCSPLR